MRENRSEEAGDREDENASENSERGDSISTIPPLSPGDRISHFVIRRLIDRGGFGYVYDAFDENLERTVALKIPHSREFSSRQKEDFLREARLAAKLNHPNIVGVHEAGEANSRIWIASDLIQGMSLTKYMRRNKLDQRQIAKLVIAICAGVEAAHKLRIIHQDLKPGNLLVDRNGHLYITDFGLAFRDEPSRDTNQFRMAGTLPYMAPEQFDVSSSADVRTDIYAIGVILYQLLTGVRPYQGARSEIIDRIQEGAPTSPRRINRGVAPALEAICLKAMSKDPERRYESAQAMGYDLQEFLEDRLPAAYSAGVLGRWQHWLNRQRWKVAVGGLLVCLVTVLLIAPFFYPAANDKRTGPLGNTLPVIISTDPPGATIAIVPIDPATCEPDRDKILQPPISMQYQVDLEPGLYLIESTCEIGGQRVIHEVLRTVPVRPVGEYGHQCRALQFRSESSGRIVWPVIQFVRNPPAEVEFQHVTGGSFQTGSDSSKQFPLSETEIQDYWLQKDEVSLAIFAKVMNLDPSTLPPESSASENQDIDSMTQVSFFDAVEFAERIGARLMTLNEFLFAATNRGKTAFPWGDDAGRLANARPTGPVLLEFDLTNDPPLIQGLHSGVAEWTMTGYPDSGLPIPPLMTLEPFRMVVGDPSVKNGGPPGQHFSQSVRQFFTERINSTGAPGLGFRCARSGSPRYGQPVAGN